MRRHARFGRLAPRYDVEAFAALVRAEHLISARLDPGFSPRTEGEGLLDLVFAHDERVVVVPWIMIDGDALIGYERSPFVWPAWLPPMRTAVVQAIEASIEPWMRSLTVARFVNAEESRIFSDDPEQRAMLDAARGYGFLGAAPTETTMQALAPYVYALPFAAGRRVSIVDPDAAAGAAMLARFAVSVKVDLEDVERIRLARRWFGSGIFERFTKPAEHDVAIGRREVLPAAPVRIALDADAIGSERAINVAAPIPPAVMISFDTNDGAAVRRFAVAAPPLLLRRSRLPQTTIVGGSAGRIGIVVRDDYRTVDDADTDAAQALAVRLEEQGFTPTVVACEHLQPQAFDLLHVVGGIDPKLLLRRLADGATAIPIVVNPLVPIALATENDAMPRLIAHAGAAIVACEEEERQLRDRYGLRGRARHVPALLAPEIDPVDIAPLVSEAPFVLAHAPVERANNQLALVNAANALGYGVVLVGPVIDVDYYTQVVASFGAGGIWLPGESLTPAEIAALYARARVFADAASAGRGLYRLARAGAFGAALVAPASGYARHCWPGLVEPVDPASLQSVAAGLKSAWERADMLGPATAARIAEQCHPFNALVATLAVYQPAAATP